MQYKIFTLKKNRVREEEVVPVELSGQISENARIHNSELGSQADYFPPFPNCELFLERIPYSLSFEEISMPCQRTFII